MVTILNIFQGAFIGLIEDEAYYWVFSQDMAWGYFDHPPLVAVWIKISSFFFGNTEAGVRFFSAISLSLTFIIIWKTLKIEFTKQNVKLFFGIVLSSFLLNAYGFITVPDTPLVFFLALFLYAFRSYLEKRNFGTYALICISILGLIYSKHHTVLVVVFAVLSNIKILKDYKLWICLLVIILGYFPHLYWQYVNDFPTFKYHLSERNLDFEYYILNSVMHFVNCIVVVGLIFPFVYYAFFKNVKTKNKFQKGLNTIVIGFIGFFFVMSFKGDVQAQWVLPITIPLILIAFQYLDKHQNFRKKFMYFAITSIILLMLVRTVAFFDIKLTKEFYKGKKWVAMLENRLENKTAVFLNTYQNPSLFWFYSGTKPYQYRSIASRKSQYDLMEYTTSFTANNPLLVNVNKEFATDSFTSGKKKFYLTTLDSLKIQKQISLETSELKTFIDGENSFDGIVINNEENLNFDSINFYIYFFDKNRKEILKKVDLQINTANKVLMKGENQLEFSFIFSSKFVDRKIDYFQIGYTNNVKIPAIPITAMVKCEFD